MNYSDQYKSPKWQKKRLEMLELTGYVCEECYETEKQLHVHHHHYVKGRKIWEYSNNELLVLCDDCHNARHEMIDRLMYQLCSFKTDGIGIIMNIVESLRNIPFELQHYSFRKRDDDLPF